MSLLACIAVGSLGLQHAGAEGVNFGLYGAAFSLLTVIWVILNAIWIYNLTVASGHFAVLLHSFAQLSDDKRIQAILVAFCFGALIEALAGAGRPIAIVSAMLAALGFDPVLAVPTYILTQVTGLPFNDPGSMVARQTSVMAMLLPSCSCS